MAKEPRAVEVARARGLARSGEARAIRERSLLSKHEVAQDIGVHEATIARWESGSRSPRGDVAVRYARLLRELDGLN